MIYIIAIVAAIVYLSSGVAFMIMIHRAFMDPAAKWDGEREFSESAIALGVPPKHLRAYGVRAISLPAVVGLTIIVPVLYIQTKLKWKKP